MDFRMYDNAIGRFYGMDALSEKNHYLSPFQFGNGNPVFWADPTGLDVESGKDVLGRDKFDRWGMYIPGFERGDAQYSAIDAGDSGSGGGFGAGNGFKNVDELVNFLHREMNRLGVNKITYTNNGNGSFSYSYWKQYNFEQVGSTSSSYSNWDEVTVGVKKYTETVSVGSGNKTKGYDFSRIDTILGFGGIAYDALELSIAWEGRYWLDARGNYQSISRLSRGTNGRYLRGVQGIRNGYNSALRTAGKVSKVGNAVGILGLGVTAAQYYNGHISGLEASVDAAFGIIGFFGPVGAIISATYFVGKLGYEYFSGNDLFDKPE